MAWPFPADGLTEDIIRALSLWRSVPVIARNLIYVYKGMPAGIQDVSQERDSRYVLEGTVRKADNKSRLTAQLIDADTDIQTSKVMDLGLNLKEGQMATRLDAHAN